MISKKHRLAFTLAETLITLGIIGIVAAITLPTLINTYKKAVTISQLKKSYSILEQTIKMAERDYGTINDWEEWNDAEPILNKYFLPYLKGAKVYGKTSDYKKAMCYEPNSKLFTNADDGHLYNWLDGVHIATPFYNKTASIRLSDGTCIGLNPSGVAYDKYVSIDINGSSRGPNIAGKDLFFYTITSKGIKPVGYDWDYDTLSQTSTRNACNNSATFGGLVCAAKIMAEGWKINY